MTTHVKTGLLGCLLAGASLVILTLEGDAAETSAKAPSKLPQVQPAKHKSYTETIPGSKVKFEMIAIPGGTFLMGSPANEVGRREDEGPQHPVRIAPFWMGKTEVTWDEYDLFFRPQLSLEWQVKQAELEKKGPKDPDAISHPSEGLFEVTFGYGHDGLPALSMTHHAAMEYCRWLSKLTGKTYRLPTEAEWEWACRAGSATAYPFGDNPKNLSDYAWFAGNSNETPHKVGTKKPNAWGLYDMQGNVGEWCIDLYRNDFYTTLPFDHFTLNPVNLPGSQRYPHVVRGGSWAEKATALRSASRRFSDRRWNRQDQRGPKGIWWETEGDFVGFRIVRAVKEADNLKGLRSKVKGESL